MKKGTILENILVEKLIFGGSGLAKGKNGKTIIIKGGAIPGNIVNLRVIKSKKDYLETQIIDVIKKSGFEIASNCNIFGKCGGCKWQTIPYEKQLEIKKGQIEESLFHIRKLQQEINFEGIIPSPTEWGYRNKIEFSFGKFISHKLDIYEEFNVGFHKQGEFSKIVDCDKCGLIGNDLNEIFKKIKKYSLKSKYPVYDQKNHEGFYRHIVIRKGFFTDEFMVIFSYNPEYKESREALKKLEIFLIKLGEENPKIKSIYLSKNNSLADTAIGDLSIIYGESVIREKIFDLTFEISPNSFFQTNSFGAEILYETVINTINKEKLKNTKVLDLYAGTGTIGMIFAKYAKEVYSIEMVASASLDGQRNAKLNNIPNMYFINEKVENFLEKYLEEKNKENELLIIDPPRAGMHPKALEDIMKFEASDMIYISCNPATLARDLHYILSKGGYHIEKIVGVDMFPQTHHIETVVKLRK